MSRDSQEGSHLALKGYTHQLSSCSDVGTLFCPGILYSLAAYMRNPEHSRVAGVTGTERIMTFLDQADPDPRYVRSEALNAISSATYYLAIRQPPIPALRDVSAEPFFAQLLRGVQTFDFESVVAVFSGLHSLLGFLTVERGKHAGLSHLSRLCSGFVLIAGHSRPLRLLPRGCCHRRDPRGR